jgi:PAS domain S-box-containing protein
MFGCGKWIMQTLNQTGLLVQLTGLDPSNKKSVTKVLHVDDELCILEISKQILTLENDFEIDNAISVAEALKKMDEQQYDAIVSDYEMPQKNGLEFLKELREKNNQIPFILFTGRGREDVAVKALNLGADSYINKIGSPETVYCELADAINKTVERKKSRKLLVESESKYRMLVEKSLQGILVTKVAPLRLVFANEAIGKILGYSPQELLSLSPEGILGLVHHDDRAVFFKRMENRLRGEKAEACFEFRAERKDCSTIWLSALANRVDYDDQPAVLGMFLDVSESKKAGEILAESEARYRELANCLPDIVFETDIKGQVLFANEGALKLSGYSQDELEARAKRACNRYN